MNKKAHETLFTAQVKSLLEQMFSRNSLKDSILERASGFFQNQPQIEALVTEFKDKKIKLEDEVAKGSSAQKVAKTQQLAQLEKEHFDFQQQLRCEREERLTHFLKVSHEIIEMAEGDSLEESQRKSAQLLGTTHLLSAVEGKNVAADNEKAKALYKAVLCLRLLDQLILENTLKDSYVSHFLGDISAKNFTQFKALDPQGFTSFISEVKIAVVMAALLQDIGNYHPDAQIILVGTSGDKDPYRTLDIDDRKMLLQINYRETIRYLIEGLGVEDYVGNSKKERDLFISQQQRKLKFIKGLLKGAINPKKGIGNLLKVPQIYASIVLSTKPNYNYKLIPKVYQALNQNAERGACSQTVVDSLHRITGDFPQGFGITYIPFNSDGTLSDHYEYAIVNRLYPENPEEPECRQATRKLTFIGYGTDIIIKKNQNLYFAESAKQLANISKQRLQEILELLVSNYQERSELDLLPRCWQPKDFFSLKENQKLWNTG